MPFLIIAVIVFGAAMASGWDKRRPVSPAHLSASARDKRRDYLKLLATDPNSVDIHTTEVWLDHHLKVSGASLSLAVAGALFLPPLRWLSLPGLLYGTVPIYDAAYRTIVQERRGGVDALYAFTHTVVIASQLFVAGNLGNFWFFLSRKLQIMARERFKQKLHDVFAEVPTTVYVLVNGAEVAQPLANVQLGDIVIVQPSETIPVDGVIAEGTAIIDEHALTGEFQPTEKTVGEPVFASTIVHAGRLLIRVQESGRGNR